MKFVDRPDARIATEAFGNPERGTIMLAMGATASMVWWPDGLIERLAKAGYQVIRFDHRDTGQSTTNSPGDVRYDLDDMVGDLIAILDAYGSTAAHIVGMSLGGYLAQIAALRHPERVLSLTLIASEPLGLDYEAAGISPEFMAHFGTMADLDWTDRLAVTDFMLGIARHSAGSAAPFDKAVVKRRIQHEIDRTDNMHSAFNHSSLAGDIDPGLTAADLHLPVLLIHGSEDPIISIEAAHVAADAVSGSKLFVLEGRGHELLERDLPEIADAIIAHCGRA